MSRGASNTDGDGWHDPTRRRTIPSAQAHRPGVDSAASSADAAPTNRFHPLADEASAHLDRPSQQNERAAFITGVTCRPISPTSAFISIPQLQSDVTSLPPQRPSARAATTPAPASPVARRHNDESIVPNSRGTSNNNDEWVNPSHQQTIPSAQANGTGDDIAAAMGNKAYKITKWY